MASQHEMAAIGQALIDLAAPTTTQRLTQTFRRNGKLQACEPCRKSKLRCDHVLPHCGRCARRKMNERCKYEASPLRPIVRRGDWKGPTCAALSTPPTSTIQTLSTSATSTSVSLQASPSSHAGNDTTERGINDGDSRTVHPVPFNPGFMGLTSFSNILSENLEHLGIDGTAEVSNDMRTVASSINDVMVAKGVEVLRIFREKAIINRFFDRLYEIKLLHCIPEEVAKGWKDRLWAAYESILTEGTPVELHALSKCIWCNTLKPINVDGQSTMYQWLDTTSGTSLRWAVVGILACLTGIASLTLISSDPIFSPPDGITINGKRLALRMWEASETCVAFCREYEVLDDLYVLLLCESDCVTASVRGEASYFSYQRSGELMNAIVAMGLHREIQTDAATPFFLAQLRLRALGCAYGSDTSLAAFLGRPPRLSYRFCVLDCAADIDDSELLLEGDELKRALAQLDENGWNTVGRVNRQTWQRLSRDLSRSREDILEMALTRLDPSELLRRAEFIRARTAEQLSKYPRFIQQELEIPWYERATGPTLRTVYMASFRLGSLSNELLLQRVLVKNAGADHWNLVQIASALFTEVLQFISRADLTHNFQIDLSWILMSHGIRSAAIVAVQLLKQELVPDPSPEQRLPRSKTIQDLSVFASRLAAVTREDGNYLVCDQGGRIIKRMLDKLLDQPPRTLTQQNDNVDRDVLQTWDTFSALGVPSLELDTSVSLVNDVDFVQWLENVDWNDNGM